MSDVYVRIIRETLGFSPDPSTMPTRGGPFKPRLKEGAVLEAEMVAFSDEENRVDGA